MNILNIYFSSTGNTAKVAKAIEKVIQETDHQVDTLEVTKDTNIKRFQFSLGATFYAISSDEL
jgi:flavodoxin